MPGHKRKETACIPEELAKIDITEIEGFDNLHKAEGIIREGQEFTASACGAGRSYFLVGGSTAGILAAISAATSYGGKLLMVRNAHRSAYNAAGLRGLKTAYIYPDINERFGFCDAVTASQVEKALDREPDCDAVFIVSPTYEGSIADVKKIAEIVHSRDKVLIVDEAHGAHLSYIDHNAGYGISACRAGADIVIQSAHKTLPAPTQTALIHLNGERVQSQRLEMFLGIYQSSSPSYPLMAGLEGAVRLMHESGRQLLTDLGNRFEKLVSDIEKECRLVEVLPFKKGVRDMGKLVVSADKGGMNGNQLARTLREKYHLETEMCGERYVLAMFTVSDEDDAFDRMKNALVAIDRELSENKGLKTGEKPAAVEERRRTEYYMPEAKQALKISDMWDRPVSEIEISESAGCIAAEFVNPYPPGTPVLVPGEIILKAHIECIERLKKNGLNMVGAEGDMIKVLGGVRD